MIKRSIFVILAALFAIVTVVGSAALPTVQPLYSYARSMAALGDSITQSANSCVPWQECPENSWSIGTNKEVYSEYQRLQLLNPKHTVKAFDNAHSGTKVNDLINQATVTTTQKPEYITILSGSNDACSPSIETMTSLKDFKKSTESALSIINKKLPRSTIFVASIPDINNLWKEGHTSPEAVTKWREGNICQSLLANPTSQDKRDQDRRETFNQRVKEYNKIWENACVKASNCFFDHGAVYNTHFTMNELTTVDYFHPNVLGQAKLAEATWGLVPLQRLYILRGTTASTSTNAPVLTPITPKNKAVVSGRQYTVSVLVESKRKIERVYANTQLGGVDMVYNHKTGYWELTVDTTLAPNKLTTNFSFVAVDSKGETGVSQEITATVDNTDVDNIPVLKPGIPQDALAKKQS